MSKSKNSLNLLDLPTEILYGSLCGLPTATLLQIRTVNHYFCNIIGRIIHNRLQKTICLDDWKLIIECYHPSRAQSEKYNFCEYIDTPSLGRDSERRFSRDDDYGLGFLPSIQARFRPSTRTPRKTNTSRQPGDDGADLETDNVESKTEGTIESPVERVLNLESHENFSQLIFSASLVQLGPANGIFKALAEVIDKKAVRIFRQWLSEHAEQIDASKRQASVWLDEQSKVAQLDIAVDRVRWRRNMPLLIGPEEDQAVSYSLELKEVRISLLHLLLGLEAYLLQSNHIMGKAMIFGSFPTSSSQPEQT